MATQPLNIDDFAAKIKAKYPDYATMDNAVLAHRIVEKYPDYASQVDLNARSAPASVPKPYNPPQSIWERLGIVPSANATPAPLQPGEQAGPSLGGSPGEMLMQGLGQGTKTAGKAYVSQGPGQMLEGAVDIAQGNISRGGHKAISGAMVTALPIMPEAIAANPLVAARAAAGGFVTGQAAEAGTKALGGSEDQQKLAGDLGNLAGGTVAGTGMIRAFLESPTKALLGRVAGATDGVISDDLLGTISPRALHGLRMLRAAAKVAGASEDSDLSAIATKHADAIGAKEQELNAALSKANALPPEGPTAQFKDVPDLRVQPSQQPPQNLLNKPSVAQAQPQPQGGAFPVVPPEGAIQESKLPDMEIYKEPIQPPKALKPPTLLEQLRQWDQIRQIHSQLEDQIGKGQDELQQWMDDHNQQAPGAKIPAAVKANLKSKGVPLPDEPRVPTSDADMEELLMRSVQQKNRAMPESAFNDAAKTFTRPSRAGTPQGIADQINAAKAGKPADSAMSRVDQHKVAKAKSARAGDD